MSGMWSFRNREAPQNATNDVPRSNVATAHRLILDAHREDYGVNSDGMAVTAGWGAMSTPRLAITLMPTAHSDPAAMDFLDGVMARWPTLPPETENEDPHTDGVPEESPGGLSTNRTTTTEGSVEDRLSRAEGRRKNIRDLRIQKLQHGREGHAKWLDLAEQKVEALEAAVARERTALRLELAEIAPNTMAPPPPPPPMIGFVGMQKRAIARREAHVALDLRKAETAQRRLANALTKAMGSLEAAEGPPREALARQWADGLPPFRQHERERRVVVIAAVHSRSRQMRYYGFAPWRRCVFARRAADVAATVHCHRRSLASVLGAWRGYTANEKRVRRTVAVARTVALAHLLRRCWQTALWRRWRASVVGSRAANALARDMGTRKALAVCLATWRRRTATVRYDRTEEEQKDAARAVAFYSRRALRGALRRWSARALKAEEDRIRAAYRQHLWSVVHSTVK